MQKEIAELEPKKRRMLRRWKLLSNILMAMLALSFLLSNEEGGRWIAFLVETVVFLTCEVGVFFGHRSFVNKCEQEWTNQTGTVKQQRHILFKSLISLGLILTIAFSTMLTYYYYEKSQIKWDVNTITIYGQEITFPCTVEDFQAQLGIVVSYENRQKEEISISNKLEPPMGYERANGDLELFIEDGMVTGVLCKNIHPTDIGLDFFVLPERLTPKDSLETFDEIYSTGYLNIFRSEWSEVLSSGRINGDVTYASKNKISLHTLNGIIEDITITFDVR